MSMINRCEVFIPILTKDYLEGPVSVPELDLAMRQAFESSSKRIIPLLIEGKASDYKTHFLGGYQIVNASSGIDSDLVKKVANMALGISNNPYE